MLTLNVVNLVQAGIVCTGALGAFVLWQNKPKEFRGIAIFLLLSAFASLINILEESGLTRDIYLISPIFILLFGPASYLATKLLLNKALNRYYWLHLLPVIPLLFFTQYTSIIIALGTMWRFGYAFITAQLLIKYQQQLNQQRSDADDYSLSWLVKLVIITAGFNLIDLVRLNFQHVLSYQENILGQGLHNAIWLIAIMLIIVKLQPLKKFPANTSPEEATIELTKVNKETADEQNDYRYIFTQLDQLIRSNQWYLTPRLTLNDISELTGLQTRDISRAVNTVAEKSFNDYINQYRVDFVCKQLTSKQPSSLLTIANDAGFSSKASFNKVFKQVTGQTPSQFKNSQNV